MGGCKSAAAACLVHPLRSLPLPCAVGSRCGPLGDSAPSDLVRTARHDVAILPDLALIRRLAELRPVASAWLRLQLLLLRPGWRGRREENACVSGCSPRQLLAAPAMGFGHGLNQ